MHVTALLDGSSTLQYTSECYYHATIQFEPTVNNIPGISLHTLFELLHDAISYVKRLGGTS